ncbi:hypothetical protein IVB22_33175 [Bradyrhizobium sp. 190]|uniref:hypothetical protein n=1 Tax=Bradyrhizobium sp. 190 TaxID=2782658 RepID=UPI001FF7E4B0|nr:hypothetical protein [Bradyrhizobium sp. 190]MCK1517273.1 hypothetical protein [Bradyrhizobium sp. 190]
MTRAIHQFFVQYPGGNVVPGAHIEVRKEIPGQPLAALYSDRAGTISIGNPFDADSDGFARFYVVGGAYQIRVYTGASGAPTDEHFLRYVAIGLNAESDSIRSRTQRIVTAAGAVTIEADDADIVIIKKTVGAATTVNLPPSADRTDPVSIVDGKYDALTNNITIDADGSETIMGASTYTIDSNGGSITLYPLSDGTGWFSIS